MPEFPVDVAVFGETTNPGNVANTGFLYTKDASGVTHLYYRDSGGTVHTLTPIPVPPTPVITWGAPDIGAGTAAVWLPIASITVFSITPVEFRVPRAGTFRNMYVYYNADGTGIEGVTYTLLVNGVATSLLVTSVNSAPSPNLVNTAVVSAGDYVSLEVTRTGTLGSSPTGITVSLSFD